MLNPLKEGVRVLTLFSVQLINRLETRRVSAILYGNAQNDNIFRALT
jgi:hypothetical protein